MTILVGTRATLSLAIDAALVKRQAPQCYRDFGDVFQRDETTHSPLASVIT